MKNVLLLSLCFFALIMPARAQYQASSARTWDRFPPEAQDRGFGVHASQLVQMDDDPALEEVFLFCRDKGHYPSFDVFRVYYVVVDYYTKEIKYKSEERFSTERELRLEDRNQDGKFELYRKYFQDDKFSTDEDGNRLQTVWNYDCIEFKSKEGKISLQK